MSYTPYVWHDGTTGGTLVTAARLNALEQGVAAAGAPDGVVYVTDYTSLDTALDTAVAGGTPTRITVVAGSTIVLSNTNRLTIDVAYAYVDFRGCLVDATALTSGIAVTVTGSVTPPYTQTAHGFDNLLLLGPGQTVAGVTGVSLDGVSTTVDHGPSHLQPQHCNVSGFATGVSYGINGYCIGILNWDIYRCAVGVKVPAGLPTGERLAITDSTIFNNTVGLSTESSGDLYLINCSFDYNTDAHIKNGSWQIDATSCHFESGDKATPDFTLTGNGSRIHLRGGSWTNTKSPTWTAPALNNANNGGGLFIDGTHLGGLTSTSGYLATGTGITQAWNTTGYDIADTCEAVADSANRLADGAFERGSVVDRWYLSDDTAPITATNQFTGSNLTIGLANGVARTGSQSLKATKTGGVGSNAQFTLVAPVPGGQRARARFYYSKPGAATGSITINARYGYGADSTTTGLPRITRASTVQTVTATFTTSPVGWTKFVLTEPTVRIPVWATCIIFDVILTGMSAGDLYLDDVEITTL